MAARGDNRSYVYRGEVGERIPRGATYVTVADDCTFVRANAIQGHRNIVTLICHDRVERIERYALCNCPRLQKVVMPGVKTAQHAAFSECEALRKVECGKLEVVEGRVFASCKSLRSINLPSAEVVEWEAFTECTSLKNVIFGSKLEEIEKLVFHKCFSLERICIPLKDGIITRNNIFSWCGLRHVDLVEEAVLHQTVAALNVEDWKNDMNRALRSNKQILLNRPSRYGCDAIYEYNDGEWKAKAIRKWIRTVLGKIVRYKAKHRRVLNEAASSLQLVLPEDLVMNHIFSFLVPLSSHTFEGEEEEESSDDESDY
jgi:hypothetical protein